MPRIYKLQSPPGWPRVSELQAHARRNCNEGNLQSGQIHATLAVSEAIMAMSSDLGQQLNRAMDRLDEMVTRIQRVM
jgi:hypothetical protein